MKKLLHIMIMTLLCLNMLTPVWAEESSQDFVVPAKHAIAIEARTGKVLYEKDATTPDGVASMTKILTSYMVYKAVNQGDLTWDSEVDISDYPFQLTVKSEAANIPLEDRKYTVKQLLDATLIASANSAAIALAEKIGGTESNFVDMMTAQLKEWGITDAHLVNASGLNNKYLDGNTYPGSQAEDENTMSALDVAIIAYHLIQDFPEVLDITQQGEVDFDGSNTLQTHNLMLEGQPNYRQGVDGLKTGTTELAGASFVAHSTENDMSLITVVMNADNGDQDDSARFTATNALLDYLVQTWEIKTLIKKDQDLTDITVIGGQKDRLTGKAQDDLLIVQKRGADNSQNITLTPNAVVAPVKTNDKITQASFKDKDLVGTGYITEQASVAVTSKQDVKESFFLKLWWDWLVNVFNNKN